MKPLEELMRRTNIYIALTQSVDPVESCNEDRVGVKVKSPNLVA